MLVNMALSTWGENASAQPPRRPDPMEQVVWSRGAGETLKVTLPFQVGHGRAKRAAVPTRGGNGL
jgi:hypothetical protein